MDAYRRPRDAGYSLVELLVVIVILGVLAAIAIPVFLNQRRAAVDASLKSDLHSVSLAIVATRSDETTAIDETAVRQASRVSPGNVVDVVGSGADVCLRASHGTGDPRAWVQDGAGMHSIADGDCVGPVAFSVP